MSIRGVASVLTRESKSEAVPSDEAHKKATDKQHRACGFTALVWAYLGPVVGLVAGTRSARRITVARRSTVLALHRQLNLVALALVVVHLASYVVEPGGSLLVALVPQTAGVAAFAYPLGVLAFYLALLLGPTWYFRDRIGRRAWLLVHQFAALSYAAGLWHALLLGGDVQAEGAIRTAVALAQAPLLALFARRLARPRRPADHLDAGLLQQRFASTRHLLFRSGVHTGVVLAAAIVLSLALVALRDGQHPTR